MRHNAGAHSRRVVTPSKWAFIISGLIVAGIIFTAFMIALSMA